MHFDLFASLFKSQLKLVFILLGHTAISQAIDPDVNRNVTEIITSKGYPCQDHSVTTADGFILGIQRIPHGVRGQINQPQPVVLLQHGLLCDSTIWVTNNLKDSLGFLLADAGFDVWLGNSRGNTYSRKHKTLSPSDEKFWDWSWDEMAEYDIPAVIDYIVNLTGQPQIYYIGHSQGTLIAFSAFSQNQQVAKKIKLFAALAPVAYLGHTETPLKVLKNIPDWILYDVFGKTDFLPSDWLFKALAVSVCRDNHTLAICSNILFLICGFDLHNLNNSRLPIYISHTPAGTSVKNMIHFKQVIKSGLYQKYDYGKVGNIQHYGQPTPPQYDPGKIQIPINLYSAGKDWLATPKDVDTLKSHLTTNFNSTFIPPWNHLDFMWGINANKVLYSKLIQDLMNV